MLSLLSRPRSLWTVAILLLVAGGGMAVRFWLGGYVVRSVLGLAGATKIAYTEVRATPWRVEVEGLRFSVRTQTFAARRVTVEREHWWMASLGHVRVEGAAVPVSLDGSDVNPVDWARYEDGGLGDEPVSLPFQTLELDGELLVGMAALPDRPVRVRLEARPKNGSSWEGSLVAEADGFGLAGNGTLLRAGQELDFQVQSAELDLAKWSEQIQRLVFLPGRPWALGGRLTGAGQGKVTAKRFAATARISLREGRMRAARQDIAATGVEAELEFSDLWKLRTKSGELRMQELRVGRLPLRTVTADFGLWNGTTVIVNHARFEALGGRAVVQPFRYEMNQREVAATVEAEDIDLAAVVGLVERMPVKLAGRVKGTLPLSIEDSGVRLERGQLLLAGGTAAAMEFGAATLLRSGAQMTADTARVLREAGNENLPLHLEELHLEIRPRDLPLGSSARVRVSGASSRGPVTFTFLVNGSVEKHLNILPQ